MNNQLFLDSLENLHNYCTRENYKGYSLYDSHNSKIPFQKFGKSVSFYSNQIIKRSPVNIRPLIGLPKGINPKGQGLFLNAYVNLKGLGIFNESNEKLIDYFFNWLVENPSKGYTGYSWGYNYDWPKKDGSMVPTYTPSSVVTGFNSRAILNYYELTKDPKAIEVLNGAKDFILNDIPVTETKDGICFAYIPLWKDLTINANLLAAEILAYSDYVSNSTEHLAKIKSVLDFTMSYQNKDGSWYYCYDLKTGKAKKQIDFHQGYVIESIYRICKYSSIDFKDYESNVIRGLEYYYQNQFDDNGRAFWRYPKQWPVDIHNQSLGIITFSNFAFFDKKYLEKASQIAKWTIENMQDKKGNFYYQKWPMMTSKISYMRWNQGWMLLALSTYLKSLKQNVISE